MKIEHDRSAVAVLISVCAEGECSAADLVEAYKANEIAADNRFKGKISLVTSVVDTISAR